MSKRTLITWIAVGLAFCFAAAEVVLLCVNQGNILQIGLPFFLCLVGLGGCLLVACLLWLTKKEASEGVVCSVCGNVCEEEMAFCPACGKKMDEKEN